MIGFRYDSRLLARFPAVVGGVIRAEGLTNGASPGGLQAAYAAEQQAVLERIGATPLSEIPSLAAWRKAFRGFGVDPTQYRSAAEALLRRLTKSGSIPGINTLVDIGNLVSIRYALPVAVFDAQDLQGAFVTVRFASGKERYRELGETELKHPEAGEVIFVDEAGVVVARRWCWRQSAESAARAETTRATITIESQHEHGRVDVEKAVADMVNLLGRYAGGSHGVDVLDANHPSTA